MTRIAFVLAAALPLTACVGHGYEYDYDPWLGPRGHHTGPFEKASHRPERPCARVEFRGPYYGGWSGPYPSGPHCAAPTGAAASVSDVATP